MSQFIPTLMGVLISSTFSLIHHFILLNVLAAGIEPAEFRLKVEYRSHLVIPAYRCDLTRTGSNSRRRSLHLHSTSNEPHQRIELCSTAYQAVMLTKDTN